MQQYLCTIEGTETTIKELSSRDEDYSKHQQALLESEDEPFYDEDASLLKSVGSVVCIKPKKGKQSYGILVEDVLVGSACSTCLMEDDRFVTFPLAVILDAVARVERDKYPVKCPMSRLRLKLAAAQQDRKQGIAGRIEASHASFHLDLARAQVMSTKSPSVGKKTKVQGVTTSSKTSVVKVKVEGMHSNAQEGQIHSGREPIVIVVDDLSDIEPETPHESKTNADANGVGSETPPSPMSRTAVQGLLAMTNTFAMATANATTMTARPTENASSTQQMSHASNALSNGALAQENYILTQQVGVMQSQIASLVSSSNSSKGKKPAQKTLKAIPASEIARCGHATYLQPTSPQTRSQVRQRK